MPGNRGGHAAGRQAARGKAARGQAARGQAASGPAVGFFGLLGSGNIGNDASLAAVLNYLRAAHPNLVVDAMCMGPERVSAAFGIEAVPLLWYRRFDGKVGGIRASLLKALGKGIDTFRIASWARKHDVVIVPGMGVLEASLPLRPWGVPYAMFLLCASGRLFGTKVALVSVGATVINQRATRWLVTSAARLASYRSYRDDGSRDAMAKAGVDTSADRVYPDLVYAIPAPQAGPGDRQIVGVGVMAYYGTNDHRAQADEIYAAYVGGMKRFVRWLADGGHRIRLFTGDECDVAVADDIVADLRAYRPDLEPGWIVAEPIASFTDLMRAMQPAGCVVATRYHNVMCALKLGKPVISLGYSGKNIALMTDMGLAEFCQFAHSLDIDRLMEQFTELGDRWEPVREMIAERYAEHAKGLDEQFTELSDLVFPPGDKASVGEPATVEA